MSQWTANFRPGIMKRSPEQDAFLRKEYGRRMEWIRRHNWKIDQIEKVKKERAIAARLSARQADQDRGSTKT